MGHIDKLGQQMGHIDKRLGDLARHVEAALSGARPVRINVVQAGPKGRENETELLYNFVLSPSGDEEKEGLEDSNPMSGKTPDGA